MSKIQDQKRFLANRQKEIDGAGLYRALAESESQPQMAALYGKFAQAEDKHAAAWDKRLADSGLPVPARRLSWRARKRVETCCATIRVYGSSSGAKLSSGTGGRSGKRNANCCEIRLAREL